MREEFAGLRGARFVLALLDPASARELSAELTPQGTRVIPLAVDVRHVRQLRAHRHKFDRAVVDLDQFDADEHDEVLDCIDAAVAPGGKIAILRSEGTHSRSKVPVSLPNYPGHAIGAVADLFVGCELVVELGSGRGHMLDAIRIRDVATVGVEADPGLAALCREHGHDVREGGLAALAAMRGGGIDGVYLGNALEQVPVNRLPDLMTTVRTVLAPSGRCVIRAKFGYLDHTIRPLVDADAWRSVRLSRLPRDADDGVLLLVAAPEHEASAAAPLAELTLSTGSLPVNAPLESWFDLERFERRVTSQCGEDGVLDAIFTRIGETDRTFVEFGCGDGVQCNTRQLQLAGWTGLLMDGGESPGAPDVVIQHEWITRDNINELFDRHRVPSAPDLMSIDLDGNDYWVLEAINRRPRVLVVEYNGNVAADRALTIPHDPTHRWDGSDYYGASLLAIERLARAKGYTLVHCTVSGVNAFFVRTDLIGDESPADPQALHRPANYWYRGGRSQPDLSRAMLDLDSVPAADQRTRN